jgi:hypothetical protein
LKSTPSFRLQQQQQQQPLQPSSRKSGGGWGGFRKLFGLGSKEESMPSPNYYTPEVSYFTRNFPLDLF